MADGLLFDINPKYCQEGQLLSFGQLKYTAAPMYSGKAATPVKKDTM